MNQILYVSKNSDGFSTIAEALASIPNGNDRPITIEIAPGIYREKLTIDKPFVTLRGCGSCSKDTVITYDDYARAPMPDGSKRGTFRSYSVFIDAHDVTLRNLTVENASGDSVSHGQAIALYAEGDRLFIDSCRLLGHQDTLFTGPLPPTEYEPGGFTGPKQYAPRINGRQYYKNCYICGDIDFIFGSATAFFEDCTLESLRRDAQDAIQGYVTAASTPEGQEYGYVFYHCNFISGDCPPNSVYLGRPWRDYAKTVLISCELGPHIHPAGFHDWDKKQAHGTVFFAEYQSFPTEAHDCCTAQGCRPFPRRADFVCALDTAEAAHFSRESVLGKDFVSSFVYSSE